jgi:hypothetical protein
VYFSQENTGSLVEAPGLRFIKLRDEDVITGGGRNIDERSLGIDEDDWGPDVRKFHEKDACYHLLGIFRNGETNHLIGEGEGVRSWSSMMTTRAHPGWESGGSRVSVF